MTRHHSHRRLFRVALCVGAVLGWNSQFAEGQTTYNFTNPSNANPADWTDTSLWSPTGSPSVAGDVAIITRPPVSPSANFSIELPFGGGTTVGGITIDSSAYSDGNNFAIDGGPILFQAASGAAEFITTADGGSPNGDRITVWNDITLVSDLVMNFEHKSNLNSSSFINSLITGADNRTLTKEGIANAEFSSHGAAGFQGKYVINGGAIRFTGNSNLQQSTGVTVNSGGQLQINANASAATYDWGLAASATLKLNGTGKTGGNAPGGALRFQGQANQSDTHAIFRAPVELQSDTEIAVGPASVTGELDNIVSGGGGLTKSAPGILLLSNAGNSYSGDTRIQEGTLSISNPFLADAADIYLATAGKIDLNFTGVDTIDSLFFNGESQFEGTWGALGNLDADFQSDRITGTGLLNVTNFVSPGVPGDYNEDGTVDAADYVLWRKSPADFGNDPDGYNTWHTHFAETQEGSGSGGAVPEPASWTAILIAAGLATMYRRSK